MRMEVSRAMAMGLLWRRSKTDGQPKAQGRKANVLDFGHETVTRIKTNDPDSSTSLSLPSFQVLSVQSIKAPQPTL
jgi:hypothetical protein